MKRKLVSIVGFFTLLLAISIIIYSVWPWLFLYIGVKTQPNPPHPAITYGEFPFRLEYEINGRRMVINDTLICEYDGVGVDEGQGKYRKWKQRLASGKERVTLLKVDDTTEIYYNPGSPRYYMGDLGESVYFKHNFPDASIIKKDGRFTTDSVIRADLLQKEYNIRLIRWDYTQPIKNSFS
ncbi:MAG: hypothetical protein C6P35_08245 [Cohnella sp.]|uniref:hypothetical protein n=1 Tax=Cohnella sp. TaxID=1883426 RepID=UPI000E394D40|nr:hypothetical protein [Cohnella sp.]REK66644.1 MAG: hypothetical protein C6P35_08245 [Cohnella sp.]